MVDSEFIDRVFMTARTHSNWQDKAVSLSLLHRVYNIARMAPTSVNCSPARFVFLTSPSAKEQILPSLVPANIEKVRSAPVTVIVAEDMDFHVHIPRLFHHRPEAMRPFADNENLREITAFRNSTLQGAYFILATRACGLDCGPMSGFDHAVVDQAFFPDGKWRSNFLINLGYGVQDKLFPRLPRLSFDEACIVL